MNEPAAGVRSLSALPAGRMGLKLALVSLAIALAAINTGNNLLYLILSLVLALASISAAAASWSLRRLVVTPVLPEEITANEPFLAGAEVRGRFPLLPQTWVRVTVSGLPHPVEIDVPVAGSRGRGFASMRLTAPGRGCYDDLSFVASTGYPLDLARRRTRVTALGARLIVLPRFERATLLRVPGAGATGRPAPSAPSREPGRAGVELHKIMPYTGREDARRIDWRSTARTRRLMLKEFDKDQERRVDLLLDPCAGTAADFEHAVERCAAILDLARRGHFDAALITAGSAAPLSGRAAMRHLAGVKPDTGTDGSSDAMARMMGQTRSGAERIVVSADPSRATPIVLV